MAKADKTPKNPLSEADVEEFERYVSHWRDVLNLRNWWVARAAVRDQANMASLISVEHEHRLARYKVGVDFLNTKVTPETLEKTALHEMIHLMLRPLIDEAIAQGEYNDAVLGYEHDVVNVLEDLLMDGHSISRKAEI